ncbi:hypothetical protein [Fuscibacter oryzae]|uniref:hypothetical protein n=1 Tax=Fuscibacter oryzae TaxID=2803939 RepID=UPI002E28F048|nr:hypothetical protein [Fuscibacter oryzae]
MDRHSATAHAAHHDLLRALIDDRAADLRGTPTRVDRAGRVYWYDSYRVGSEVRKTCIGEDSPRPARPHCPPCRVAHAIRGAGQRPRPPCAHPAGRTVHGP